MTDKAEPCAHCGEDISEQVAGLKNTARSERETRKELERELKELKAKNAGADIDEMQASIADGEAKNAALLEEVKQLKQERDDALGERDTAKTQIRDGQIATAVAEAGGNLALLKPALRESLGDDATPEQIAEKVAAMRNDDQFGAAFKATTHSGSGSLPDTQGGQMKTVGSKYPARRSEFTERQKVDYQNEHGLDAYMDIPA